MKVKIEEHQIDVWLVNLEDTKWDASRDLLGQEELANLSRFRSLKIRNQRTRCRASVRRILSEYLETRPADLEIVTGPSGKPAIMGASIHFNVSHSGDFALVAVSGSTVGVDIERVVDFSGSVDELIGVVCHPIEAKLMTSLTPHLRALAFYGLWTKKESYCKATGSGIGRNLKALRVKEGDGCLPAIVEDDESNTSAPHYLHELVLMEGYVACVCTQSEKAIVTIRDTSSRPPT